VKRYARFENLALPAQEIAPAGPEEDQPF
jgi:hypothetical protein